MTNKWSSHLHHAPNWIIHLLFKIVESANTCQILRTSLPTPLLRRHKCTFPFRFSKVWFVCMKMKFWILWKFNQVMFCQAIEETKLIFPTISDTFWTTFWEVYVSNHHICLLFVTRFCFWNVNDGNGKLK